MDDAERRTMKRSRFDQTEPEPRRPSRFDRRSRSPPSKRSDAPRERSPISRPDGDTKRPGVDPAAAAAAAAAKINAQLQAKKGIHHADVPSIKSPSDSDSTPAPPLGKTKEGGVIGGDMYVSDGDYIKDIEINDLRNKYVITRSATLNDIKAQTGADVTTRGKYLPDKSMATPTNPPLYLHVTSTSKEGLEKAVAIIEDLMKQELPNLVDERRLRRREQDTVERDEYGRRKWPEEKIPINLEPLPGFNLRAQVVGQGGAYVKHIQHETGCRVQIKGRGSGFLEQATNRESDEDMFLHVTGREIEMVQKAKELCEDLIDNVKQQYEEFKSRPPRSYGGGGGGDHRGGYGERRTYGDRGGYGDRGSYGDHGGHGGHGGHPSRGGDSYHGYGRNSYSNEPRSASPNTPTTSSAPTATTSASAADYAAQYAQYYGGQDPYAAYGGYAAYVQYYQQYYAAAQAQAAQQGSPAPPSGPAPPTSAAPPPPPADSPPPPPPPSTAAPPPPPPGSGPSLPGVSGGYGSVPPPPGL
ncbi:hypothetical protein SAPIO_CDS2838 [Scedosporium apiospermum]|uniref:K Homology domain-containing protein n=1 Tax=Pseudallescheria apiosperma TaxID=563466 RepID=A0A084GBN1_PSEDA|nr:uncharacterized protein SAPIO_CDS2838 [Scedosporium apiospermum]KEZ44743.1 hypothetical protein SAPIO_CDS2838 [Scedosporium apiospermum]